MSNFPHKFFRSLLSQSLVGLDIGSHSVKMVELRYLGRSVHLSNFGLARLKKTDEEDVVRAIKDLIRLKKIRAREVVTCISGSSVATRQILVPDLPQSEMARGVKWEAKKHVPFDLNEAIFDYLLLGQETDRDGIRKNKVIILAVRTEDAFRLARLVARADMVPVGITTVPFVFWNLINIQSPEADAGKVIVCIDLGASVSTVLFFKDRKLQLFREIDVGGRTFTQGLMGSQSSGPDEVRLAEQEAEDFKQKYGILFYSPAEIEHSEKIDISQASGLLRPVLERLLNEIRISLHYYFEQFPESEEIDRLVIAGGTAVMKNIDRFLSESLDMKVELLNPFAGFGMPQEGADLENLSRISPCLAVATGLALDRAARVNLLPKRFKVKRKFIFAPLVVKTILFVLAFLLIAFYGAISIQSVYLQKAIISRENQIRALRPRLEQVVYLNLIKEKILKKTQIYDNLVAGQLDWYEMLRQISLIVPESVLLREITLTDAPKRIISMKGTISSGERTPETTLAVFTRGMKDSSYFTEVNLVSTEEKTGVGVRAIDFVLTAKF